MRHAPHVVYPKGRFEINSPPKGEYSAISFHLTLNLKGGRCLSVAGFIRFLLDLTSFDMAIREHKF